MNRHARQLAVHRLPQLARQEAETVKGVARIEEIADRILWLEDGRLRDRKTGPHDWVRCPVCGMRVDRWTAVHVISDVAGEHIFCSERCRRRYQQSPGTYMDVSNV